MISAPLLLAALLLPPLLYLPGWALSRRFAAPIDLLERHFERVVVGALWNGWLALLLATLGFFSLWMHLALTLTASALLVFAPGTRRPAPPQPLPRWEPLAHALVLLVALLLFARPFETILGVRDAGVYATTGIAIARTGALVQSDPLLAIWGHEAQDPDEAIASPARQSITNYTISQPRERYIASRLRAAGFFINEGELSAGRVIPQGLHLFPAWIGLLTALGGPGFGLFAPGLLALLGVWSVGMLGRRLAGPWVGLLAMALLALNGVQIWFARYSTAETAAQFLIWAGLYFFARAFGAHENEFAGKTKFSQTLAPGDGDAGKTIFSQTVDDPGRTKFSQTLAPGGESGRNPSAQARAADGISSFLSHPSSFILHPSSFPALLAGLAIGQVALTRIDFFLLGPLLAFLLYSWLTRRWLPIHTALALGMGLMLLHAALHISFVARAYFFDTAHERLLRDYALFALLSLPFLSPAVRESFLTSPRSALVRPVNLPGELELGAWVRLVAEVGLVLVVVLALLLLRTRLSPSLARFERRLVARRAPLLSLAMAAVLLLGAYAYFVRPAILDADILLNTRSGWNDPLTRDPALVAADVRSGRMRLDEARNQAGVVLSEAPLWLVAPDLAATAALREQLRAERGPWAGPFSNQTLNWLRLQGYVGAPIRVPFELWYSEYAAMNWWQRLSVDPASLSSEPAPLNPKYLIPLANLVRVGWYLSPLGILLGIVGYALWLRRGLSAASWLFLAVAFVGTLFYVRQTYGTSDQHYIYILRRFVPITYPAFALAMAYALVALAGRAKGKRQKAKMPWLAQARFGLAVTFTLLLFTFHLFTNRPIIAHTEYQGAIAQLDALAARFTPGRDVLLMRGGAPIYAESRDVPDLVATPLRFAHGLDAFAVKSTNPSQYADDLAAAASRLRSQGRDVYLLLSASGASFVLPGFALEPVADFVLDVPEFEQLTDQKPRNVSRLSLPFAIYRLTPAAPGSIAAPPAPITPNDFAAQVVGLHRPELRPDGSSYAWSNGEATLRLPWPANSGPRELQIELAAGERPAHLGPAQLCLSALPEVGLWPTTSGTPVDLGCFEVGPTPAPFVVRLDPAQLPSAPGGSLLLRLSNRSWIAAFEDPRQSDRRDLGIQLGRIELRTAP